MTEQMDTIIKSDESLCIDCGHCVIQACARIDERAAPPAAMIAIARIKLAHPPLIEAMGLPDGCIPFGTFVIGYPAEKYQRIPVRRLVDVTWR
jgi:hypothetical protein